MPKYPTSFRVWGLLTAGLTVVFMAWEYRTVPRPRDTLWDNYCRLASGADPLSNAGPIVVGTLVLAAFLSIPAWIVYATAVLLMRLLTRRPCSDQAPDYDDIPPRSADCDNASSDRPT